MRLAAKEGANRNFLYKILECGLATKNCFRYNYERTVRKGRWKMDEILKQKLKDAGVDLDGALHRFMGNEALYLKFLVKFKDDKNYGSLATSLEEENFEEAFKASHTLKGVSANLGLNSLSEITSTLTELLRGKEASEVDREMVAQQKLLLEDAYQVIIAIINEV